MSQAISDKAAIEREPDTTRRASTILFTAFEPSGDAHAAPVIRELKRAAPEMTIVAWGGPKMAEAGATVLEQTTDDATMGLGSLRRVVAVRRQINAIKRWSGQHRVLAHVAVDSPAANFPVCKIMKDRGAKVVHLVAPQMWAWGRWRVRKLRRLTDLVLCLLPFEEQWFGERGIPAKFIGHPVMCGELDLDALQRDAKSLPQSSPRIAIFPGSRTQEVRANIGLLNRAYAELQSRHAGVTGVIAAARPELGKLIKKRIRTFPTGLHLTVGKAETVIAWCDFALAVSGTISMDIARQHKPMIAVYKTDLLSWLGSKLLLRTPFRLLPNIVADHEVCPEFIPHVGGAMPIVVEASKLITDSKNAALQTEALRRLALQFQGKHPGPEAAELILKLVRTGKVA
jgi:lipid-A-disaccharide synthase